MTNFYHKLDVALTPTRRRRMWPAEVRVLPSRLSMGSYMLVDRFCSSGRQKDVLSPARTAKPAPGHFAECLFLGFSYRHPGNLHMLCCEGFQNSAAVVCFIASILQTRLCAVLPLCLHRMSFVLKETCKHSMWVNVSITCAGHNPDDASYASQCIS